MTVPIPSSDISLPLYNYSSLTALSQSDPHLLHQRTPSILPSLTLLSNRKPSFSLSSFSLSSHNPNPQLSHLLHPKTHFNLKHQPTPAPASLATVDCRLPRPPLLPSSFLPPTTAASPTSDNATPQSTHPKPSLPISQATSPSPRCLPHRPSTSISRSLPHQDQRPPSPPPVCPSTSTSLPRPPLPQSTTGHLHHPPPPSATRSSHSPPFPPPSLITVAPHHRNSSNALASLTPSHKPQVAPPLHCRRPIPTAGAISICRPGLKATTPPPTPLWAQARDITPGALPPW